MKETLKNLTADRSHTWPESVKRQAPHKPFLLLSVMDGVEQGWISINQVALSQNLVDTFFTYWNGIMGEERVTTIALPFYHMKSESFWELQYKPGKKELTYSPSLGTLRKRVQCAIVDPTLFEHIQSQEQRNELRHLLAHHYFDEPTAKNVLQLSSMNLAAQNYAEALENMTNRPFESHHTNEEKLKYQVNSQQVRDRAFSRNVRDHYQYRCAVCKNRVITPEENTLAEGAHIIPWNESYNDDPRNGLSLCRNHHWLFDRLMFTIRPDYSVNVSPWLNKHDNIVHEETHLKNREILLPDQSQYYPAEEALQHHNERFREYNNKL